MSDDTIKFPTKPVEPEQTLDYARWVAEGYLYVIHKALAVVANDPNIEVGKYSIEIGFKTNFPGIVAPDWIIQDQTILKIILNNQFSDLVVDETGFSVTLFFNGEETPLIIPFAAIVWFQDGNGFTLSFEYPTKEEFSAKSLNTDKAEETTADVVSLDAFRSSNNDEGDT